MEVAAATVKSIGQIDILINNAGIVSGNMLLDLTQAQIERTFGVNFFGGCWTCQAFLPGMIERRSGHVVTISSVMGMIASSGLTDYCASKFAALGFAHCLRMELYKLTGGAVGSSVICPYAISTGMFAGIDVKFQWLFPILKPTGVAEEVLQAVLYKKPMVVLPWTVMVTEAIIHLCPIAVADFVAMISGGLHGMDTFVGRRKDNAPTVVSPVPVDTAVSIAPRAKSTSKSRASSVSKQRKASSSEKVTTPKKSPSKSPSRRSPSPSHRPSPKASKSKTSKTGSRNSSPTPTRMTRGV